MWVYDITWSLSLSLNKRGRDHWSDLLRLVVVVVGVDVTIDLTNYVSISIRRGRDHWPDLLRLEVVLVDVDVTTDLTCYV